MVRPAPPTLAEAARVAGGYAWFEEQLFEILGAWVPSVADPEVKLHLDADSRHHAWHATLWRDRLPVLRELDAGSLVAPPSAALEDLVAAVRASPTTIERLVGVYRVLLPRQIARYQDYHDQASAVTDGPTIRALDLVLADELRDWRRGELLLLRLLASADDVRLATQYQAALETLAIGGGGGRESNPPDGDHPSQPL